jgi:hypothetical protein
MTKITEIIGLFVFLCCIIMCNTQRNKQRALFVKICKIDSISQQIDCQVYFFKKIDSGSEIEKSISIDSLIKNNESFIGESLKNSAYLQYIDKDTINLFIHEPKF